MRNAEGEVYTADNNEKAEIPAAKLFPTTEEADLTDIDARESLNDESIRALDIDYKVSEEELRKTVNWLPKNKAPGPGGITSEVIKLAAPPVMNDLAEAMTTCMANGIIPDGLKESTTVVLRKEGKKDYSLPGAYRLIALENTLAKLMEKIVTTRIVQAAGRKSCCRGTKWAAENNALPYPL